MTGNAKFPNGITFDKFGNVIVAASQKLAVYDKYFTYLCDIPLPYSPVGGHVTEKGDLIASEFNTGRLYWYW